MHDLAALSGIFFLVFAASFGLSYAISKLVIYLRPLPMPPDNATLRIRGEGGLIYRARFLGPNAKGWSFSVPMQRDSYVPLRVGEALTIEATAPGGLLLFRSKVIDRQTEPQQLVIDKPARVMKVERRKSPRTARVEGLTVRVDDVRGTLVDLSSRGACFESPRLHEKGERIRLQFPFSNEPVFGWLLDVQPKGRGAIDGSLCRVVFEEAIDLPS